MSMLEGGVLCLYYGYCCCALSMLGEWSAVVVVWHGMYFHRVCMVSAVLQCCVHAVASTTNC